MISVALAGRGTGTDRNPKVAYGLALRMSAGISTCWALMAHWLNHRREPWGRRPLNLQLTPSCTQPIIWPSPRAPCTFVVGRGSSARATVDARLRDGGL